MGWKHTIDFFVQNNVMAWKALNKFQCRTGRSVTASQTTLSSRSLR